MKEFNTSIGDILRANNLLILKITKEMKRLFIVT